MYSLESLEEKIHSAEAILVYFSAPDCAVCKVLKPKLFEAIASRFDAFECVDIDITREARLAPRFGVFCAPTVLVFFQAKEYIRKSHNMSIDALIREIQRPYWLMQR